MKITPAGDGQMIQSDTNGIAVSPSISAGTPPQRIHFSGVQSLRTVATLRATLLQALESERPLEVDLSDIDDADIGVLQLLIAAERSAFESGRTLHFYVKADTAMGRLLVSSGALGDRSVDLCDGATPWNFQQGVFA